MTVAVALLRGINVGGRNKIRMADLRDLCDELGLCDARTVLQSGNIVFETAETDLKRVKLALEVGIASHFGLEIQVLLRSAAEYDMVISRGHFSAEQLLEGGKAAVVFLSDTPDPADIERLREGNPGRELIHAARRELYIYYSDGMARSKLDNKRIEGQLGLVATARNWNTCLKLFALLDAD